MKTLTIGSDTYEVVDEKARNSITLLSEEIVNAAGEVEALESLSECGVITPAYQDGVFYTDASGAIYVL